MGQKILKDLTKKTGVNVGKLRSVGKIKPAGFAYSNNHLVPFYPIAFSDFPYSSPPSFSAFLLKAFWFLHPKLLQTIFLTAFVFPKVLEILF